MMKKVSYWALVIVILVLLIPAAVSASCSTNLCSGLVAYWNMTVSGGKITDSAYLKYNLTTNATAVTSGKMDRAARFINQNAWYNQSTGLITAYPLCFAEWIKIHDGTSFGSTFSIQHGHKDTSPQHFAIGFTGNPYRLNLNINNGAAFTLTNSSQAPIVDTKWHYVVVCFPNSTSQKMWVDTNLVLKNTSSITFPSTSLGGIWIGQIAGSATYLQNGTIDGVGLWNRTLSYADILALYNNGNGLPYTSFAATNTSNQRIFTFKREATNAAMNMSASTNTLSMICPNETLQFNINTSQFTTTSFCNYSALLMQVSYNGTVYTRQLNPLHTQKNITFYLMDLRYDAAVETLISLNDLTGYYRGGSVTVTKVMTDGVQNIIQEPFDLENKVTLYLLKDNQYVLNILTSTGTATSLGNLIGSAASYAVTLPVLSFNPTNTFYGNAIQYEYTYNATNGKMSVQYRDTKNSTTGLAFKVYNGTNKSILLYSAALTAPNTYNATMTYSSPSHPNAYYYSCLYINHSALNFTLDCKYFNPSTQNYITTLDQYPNSNIVKNIIAFAVIAIILLTFGARTKPMAGVALAFFTWFFIGIGWLNVGASTYLIGAFAALTGVFLWWSGESER